MRIIISIFYVINPVIPYYFTSLLLAFAVVFLPLSLKFFVRALRKIENDPNQKISIDFVLSATFLALAISAHEQFILSAGVLGVFFIATFTYFSLKKSGGLSRLPKVGANIVFFVSTLLLVNLPLLLSQTSVATAEFSTYFTGRLSDFVANVVYSYSHTNLVTLLRFGGDSGVGLQQSSWYDSSSFLNIFGYSILILIIASVIILTRQRTIRGADKAFFTMTFLLFLSSIGLLLFVGYLPSNPNLTARIFNGLLETWESPTKLRAVVFLSALATSLVTLQKIEFYGKTQKGKAIKGIMLAALVASVVVYNSPWLVGYAESTPLQQISGQLQWGSLSNNNYLAISNFLASNYSNQRGLIIPYTHESELYAPPNFRLFQLISDVNNQLLSLTQGQNVSWSKILGLLSTKYLVINNGQFNPNEILEFPKPYDQNITEAINQIKEDPKISFVSTENNFQVYDNLNALPEVYASNYFVLYNCLSSLKYALNAANFTELPIFINSGNNQPSQLIVPKFISGDNYQIYAVVSGIQGANLALNTSEGNTQGELILDRTNLCGQDLYSTSSNLVPGEIIQYPNSGVWTQTQQINKLVLNSTTYQLGDYGSFMLNFTVSILKNGQYSFLSPRVLIGSGNQTQYYLIFHDDGTLELAMDLGNTTYTPGIMVSSAGYSLKNTVDSINVTVSKVFDQVQVYVNGLSEMSFPIEASNSTLSLCSQESISNFTDATVQTENIVDLFAARNSSSPLDFSVEQQGADQSIIKVSNSNSDYAVLDQYLETPLRCIQSNVNSTAVTANLFFNGWIIDPKPNQGSTSIVIGIKNSDAFLAVTGMSIALTYTMLIAGCIPVVRKRLTNLVQDSILMSRGKIIEGSQNDSS